MIIRCRSPLRIIFAGGASELSPFIEQRGGLNTTINLYAYSTLKLRNNKNSFVFLPKLTDYGCQIWKK